MHKLLIKTGFGRVLLDSDAGKHAFRLEPSGGKWLITVEDVSQELADEISRVLTEVHMFYFERTPSLDMIQKWWVYDIQLPLLEYEGTTGKLRLTVDSKVGYSN